MVGQHHERASAEIDPGHVGTEGSEAPAQLPTQRVDIESDRRIGLLDADVQEAQRTEERGEARVRADAQCSSV